jgi:low temperature requirement protein LtrA
MAFSIRYAAGFGLAAAIWLVSLTLPEGMRPWVWAAALAVDLVTPWMAEPAAAERTFDVSHIPERYGLFTLIVLGEAIIAVARGMSEAQWTPEAMTAAVAGFAIAVVIWWAYFAHPRVELPERGPWHLSSGATATSSSGWVSRSLASASGWASKRRPPGMRCQTASGTSSVGVRRCT